MPAPRRALLARLAVVTALALAFPLSLGAATPAAAAPVPAPGGFAESYGLSVDTTVLADSAPVVVGPLAQAASSCLPEGEPDTETVIGPVGDKQVARAEVLRSTATTDCDRPTTAKSTARATEVDALGIVASFALHADAITATSTTSCTEAPKGSTVFANLTVGGTPVVTGQVAPNTDLLPQVFGPLGLRVILNEQRPAASGRGLVVNGVHIIASNGGALPVGGGVLRGDIIISHAVSGVVCPGGPGSDNGGLPAPDIRFDKDAAPLVASQGDTVTYTATVKNTSSTPCEVLRFIDHLSPAFTFVSTAGAFGSKPDEPQSRGDGGTDVVLRPSELTIAPGASVTQTFTVKVKDDAAPGTYFNSLEILCGLNGNFISGPLAPVIVTGPLTGGSTKPLGPPVTVTSAGPDTKETLPRTGGAPLVALVAALLVAGALGLRRVAATR